MNKCNKCGQTIDYSFRYCPSCGSQAYTSLESTNAKPESFLDLFNSLYNLLADINNNKRSAYLPSFSEQIITRRCKLEYEDDYSDMVRSLAMKFVSPDASENLYHLYLTNTLTGYTYRSIEEIIVKKKSDKLSESDKISLMTSLFAEAGDDLKRSCYKVLDSRNDLDNRVLFCLSLRWDNRHMKYQLAEDNYQNKWCSLILSQNVLTSLKHHENIFKLLLPGANVKIMVDKKRSAIEDGVQQDFLFGYIVKLVESLNPYE